MFYFVFRIPEIFEKAQKTIAFILVETEPSVRLVSPGRRHLRAVELPGAVVLQNQKQPKFGGTCLRSQPRSKSLVSPHQVHAQILLALCHLPKCAYLIFQFKKAAVIDLSIQQIFIQYLYVQKIKKKRREEEKKVLLLFKPDARYSGVLLF